MKKGIFEFNNGWCFATVNGRLAEIYFKEKYGIYGHCYVKRKEYSKGEQKIIDSDIQKYSFTYRKGYYIDKYRGTRQKIAATSKIFPRIKKFRQKNKKFK
ncbi:MAG: hypothetical protein Q7R84_01375 [bacterium]|nr:hypothetical protein [bacterium]